MTAPELRTCYCGTTATVVPGAFPHPDCDGSVPAQPQAAPELAAATPPLGTAWRLLDETRGKLAIATAALKRLADLDYNPDNPGEQTFEIAEDALHAIAKPGQP